MRRSIPALTLAVVLAACSPTSRDYGSGPGGSSSGTGAGSSSSSTGGGPKVHCTESGNIFDILTTTDFGDGTQLDDEIVIVADPGQMRPMVHVLVGDHSGRTFVRTLLDSSNPLGNLVVYGNATAPSFHLAGGWMDPAQGIVAAGEQYAQGVGTLTFPVDPNQGVLGTPAPTLNVSATPSDCVSPNHIDRLQVAPDGTALRYVTSCVVSGDPDESLWVGGAGSFTKIATAKPGDLVTVPKVYTYVGGNHFIAFSQDMGNAAFLYGPDSALAAMPYPFTLDATKLSIVMSFAPLPTNDGLVLFAADFDATFSAGSIWGGAVPISQFPTLQTKPASLLQTLFSFTDVSMAAGFNNPTVDANHIVTAGPSLTKRAVFFDLLTREGAPLVLQRQVYATTTTTVTSAVAGPLGVTQVVVWMEHDGANPPVYSVRGQELICTGG